jgi:hypothetical protein
MLTRRWRTTFNLSNEKDNSRHRPRTSTVLNVITSRISRDVTQTICVCVSWSTPTYRSTRQRETKIDQVTKHDKSLDMSTSRLWSMTIDSVWGFNNYARHEHGLTCTRKQANESIDTFNCCLSMHMMFSRCWTQSDLKSFVCTRNRNVFTYLFDENLSRVTRWIEIRVVLLVFVLGNSTTHDKSNNKHRRAFTRSYRWLRNTCLWSIERDCCSFLLTGQNNETNYVSCVEINGKQENRVAR